ncbi:hypothetical protein CMQ_5150 [Grosmannia clavigera kw1407]|uniref:Uncharacterized protein n=1 Tax=Grosmannia clavigera (strain kw1407 / UAMH 11150) TaxID=655863 RepID=F0XBN1_GROCL|nr:uncharacterized protein CMQ_5150 [Grosmannia clavigera kw1407]EFX04888.1 hypothetical protein CMQ_5150 [Grosmannia clavigera kw1407]
MTLGTTSSHHLTSSAPGSAGHDRAASGTCSNCFDKDDGKGIKVTNEGNASNTFSLDRGFGSGFSNYTAPKPKPDSGFSLLPTTFDRTRPSIFAPDSYQTASRYPPSLLRPSLFSSVLPERPVGAAAVKPTWKHDTTEGNKNKEHDKNGRSDMVDTSVRDILGSTQSDNSDIVRLTESVSRIERDLAGVLASIHELQKDVQTALNAAANTDAGADADAADSESTATENVEQTHGCDDLYLYGQAQVSGCHAHCCGSHPHFSLSPTRLHTTFHRRQHHCDRCGSHVHSSRMY